MKNIYRLLKPKDQLTLEKAEIQLTTGDDTLPEMASIFAAILLFHQLFTS
jgi:hypothetical protein